MIKVLLTEKKEEAKAFEVNDTPSRSIYNDNGRLLFAASLQGTKVFYELTSGLQVTFSDQILCNESCIIPPDKFDVCVKRTYNFGAGCQTVSLPNSMKEGETVFSSSTSCLYMKTSNYSQWVNLCTGVVQNEAPTCCFRVDIELTFKENK